jgi:hypothetical protein
MWYCNNGSDFQRMRLDYMSSNGSVFMSEIYDYISKDKYQVCGSTCTRATWTTPVPEFQAVVPGTYEAMDSCPVADYQAFQSCSSSCSGYVANSPQTNGVYELGFDNNSLCLVRWEPSVGQQYGNEFHIVSFYSSGFPSQDPSLNSTYYGLLVGLGCPQPICFAKIGEYFKYKNYFLFLF